MIAAVADTTPTPDLALPDPAIPDPAVSRPVRRDPAALAEARARTLIETGRARWRLPALAAQGRGAGRVAARLARLPKGVDLRDPALRLLADPAEARRVFATAAAALAGHRLALAVTPAERAEADALVDASARRFALAHRHLALPLDDTPLPDLLAHAAMLVGRAWRARLPRELAASLPDDDVATAPPVTPPAAAPAARTAGRRPRLGWPGRRRPPLPADPAAVPPALRPDGALDAALSLLDEAAAP